MLWQIPLLLSIFASAISVLVQKVLLKDQKNDPIPFAILSQLLTALLIGVFLLIRGTLVHNILSVLPFLVLMTILYSLGNILAAQSLKLIDASEYTIIFSLRVMWSILGAIIFLKESFTVSQFIGSLLIITAIALLSWQSKKITFSVGALIAIFASMAFGLGFVVDAFIIRSLDPLSFTFLNFLLPGLGIALFFPRSIKKIKPYLRKSYLTKMILLSFFWAVTAIGLFYAYDLGRNAAQISALYQTSSILAVILSIIFLQEKSKLPQKLLAIIMSFIGILLIK